MLLSFDRFLNVRSAYGASFDAEGRRLYFVSTAGGIPGLWSVRLDRAGSWPEPLAVGQERVQYAVAGPRNGQIVFGLDRGGDERTQLSLIDGPGTAPLVLTTDQQAIHHFGAWSPDGRQIAYASNEREQRHFDIYVRAIHGSGGEVVSPGVAVEPNGVTLLYRHDSSNRAAAFAPDWGLVDSRNRRILVERIHAPFHQELLVVAAGTARSLTAVSPPARYQRAGWAARDGLIYCLTDRGRDYLELVTLDPESGQLTALTDHGWDVEDFALAPDGAALVYVVNRDGYADLYLRDLVNGTERQLESPPGSLCYDAGRWLPTFAWSRDSRRLACTLTTATSPPDVWIAGDHDWELQRVTRSWDADIPATALAEPELVHYPTFDGRDIPAFVFRPPGVARGDGTLPALFFVHGGPESQLRPSFNPVIQYFAQRGFLVLAPNVRGSTGYGKAFSSLDDVARRLDSVRDLAAGAEWLAASGEVHPGRIAVMGASYGGYMVLAALTERPDLWAAGVEIVGISNFVTFLERTADWRRHLREAEYGSLAHHRTLLEQLSPIHKADQIVAPLMVIHGANDPRVPISEAEQIVETLRSLGRPVEYLRFEDEGHGLVKLRNRLVAYPRIGDFLERALLGRD